MSSLKTITNFLIIVFLSGSVTERTGPVTMTTRASFAVVNIAFSITNMAVAGAVTGHTDVRCLLHV